MKRIGILTAGGDTPALNATILGAVQAANESGIEILGLLNGFASFFEPNAPHVPLNPLFQAIPELDATRGGTILGSSRTYVDSSDLDLLAQIADRIARLQLDGLICIGGDGTMNGLQPLCDIIPTVLAPKTIDNDLGLNYAGEAETWELQQQNGDSTYIRRAHPTGKDAGFSIDKMINYATPGYATAVYEAAEGVRRVRTTAESHRRIAIIEVMGRHSGYIALGASYGQPDIILIPESRFDIDELTEKVRAIYDHQQHVVLVCGEGIIDTTGLEYGAASGSTDPSGNVVLSGAASNLASNLHNRLGDDYFTSTGYFNSGKAAFFTRKVGHTQRGGRPLAFDRFYASQLGGNAVRMLLNGANNEVSTLQWSPTDGFTVNSHPAALFRDKYGEIHARTVHESFYDAELYRMTSTGREYLLPIFTNAIGSDDTEYIRQSLFDSGNLYHGYKSVNIQIAKRVRYLD